MSDSTPRHKPPIKCIPCRVTYNGSWYHIDGDGTVCPTEIPTSSRWVNGQPVDETLANLIRLEAISISQSKTLYTIIVSNTIDTEPRSADFFDWLESTNDGAEFLSASIAGNVTAMRTNHVARRFGIPFNLLWGIVLACYEHDGYLGTFVSPSKS